MDISRDAVLPSELGGNWNELKPIVIFLNETTLKTSSSSCGERMWRCVHGRVRARGSGKVYRILSVNIRVLAVD